MATWFRFFRLGPGDRKSEKKKIAEIFREDGANSFRELESKIVSSLSIIRNHVIAVGGGTLEKDESFHILKSLGLLIWVDTAPTTIASRLVRYPSELKKRPLLSDLSSEGDKVQLHERLKVRLETLHSERARRYLEAPIVLQDDVSTPEVCARKVIHLVNRLLSQRRSPADDPSLD